MTTTLLIRHGQSQANVDGRLAGHLDSPLTEEGIRQARHLATSLKPVPVRLVAASPLSRCVATASELLAGRADPAALVLEEGVIEVRYGAWTGRGLKELADEELWRTVQSAPSTVTFPASAEHDHESMGEMAHRAWEAWSRLDSQVSAQHGERAVWALVSHGDVIKALLARAMGLELDAFQSIVVDPASVSIVHRHAGRTAVSGLNVRDDIFERLTRSEKEHQDTASVGVVGGGDA